MAMKVLLNAIRVARDQILAEKLTKTFTEVLAHLQQREDKKMADPMLQVQPLIE